MPVALGSCGFITCACVPQGFITDFRKCDSIRALEESPCVIRCIPVHGFPPASASQGVSL